MTHGDARERLVAELTATLTGPLLEAGFDLDALAVTPAGRRRVLRVAVDKDGGVSLDDVAEATRLVSRVLDGGGAGGDVMGDQPYTLEVTSPGVDRPLTLVRHWRRNVGRLVEARTTDGRVVTGRVLDAGEDAATLQEDRGVTTLPYADVARATVQVELNRVPAGPPTDEEE